MSDEFQDNISISLIYIIVTVACCVMVWSALRPNPGPMKQTQQQRILAILEAVRSNDHDIAEEYLRRHPTGHGISARYFKQAMLISETNGRISELRTALQNKNLTIESSTVKDAYGFRYQRLRELPDGLTTQKRAETKKRQFAAAQ